MSTLSSLLGLLRRLGRDRRGNVLMLMGFAIIPLTFATGMVIDYSRAARLQTKLNAVADAAALSAVTAAAMNLTDATVQANATQMFSAQASALNGLDGAPTVTISITHPDGNNSRSAQVLYRANSLNTFGGVLRMRDITINGSSTAKAVAAPDMNFYIALDTSPSMALPTTTDGINTLDTALHCSFACHSNKIEQYVPPTNTQSMSGLILNNTTFNITNGNSTTPGPSITVTSTSTSGWPAHQTTTTTIYPTYAIDANSYVYKSRPPTNSACSDKGNPAKDICVYNNDGTYVDSYWYALNKNIPLRVTAERGAVQDLMTLAKSYAQTNKRTYNAGIWTFDHKSNLQTILAMPKPTNPKTSNLDAASAAASNISLVQVNDRAGNGRPPNGESGTEYLFTSYGGMMSTMSSALPTKSGLGTDAAGDTPQAYLFIITDGMSDENLGSGRTRSAMPDSLITPTSGATCTAIKGRGIKIAILYTEYTTDSIKDDEPGQKAIATAAIPNIAPQLTKCASPGLMYTVHNNESISTALQTLFSRAIATARLIQ